MPFQDCYYLNYSIYLSLSLGLANSSKALPIKYPDNTRNAIAIPGGIIHHHALNIAWDE